MPRDYRIIDADGHILEPPTLWLDDIREYGGKEFLDDAPRVAVAPDRVERLFVEGRFIGGGAKGVGRAGAIGARNGTVPADLRYADGRRGGFDPHARIADLDIDGIDAAVLFPSLGLLLGEIERPQLAARCSRAYNRWIVEYCRTYPDRLFPVASLPLQSIDLAIEEMRYARKELGIRCGFVRPNPYRGRVLHDRVYDTFWAAAQDLDFAIAFHEGGGHNAQTSMPAAGVERFESRGARHIVSHTTEMMLASLSIIWGGVCERFPGLRFAFMEAGGGWMAPWLDRMDRHFEDRSYRDPALKLPPSEYFRRQCWISFEPVEGTLPYMAEYLGATKILWATDYPHGDGFFPGAPAAIASRLGTSEPLRRAVLAGGAMEFYRIGGASPARETAGGNSR